MKSSSMGNLRTAIKRTTGNITHHEAGEGVSKDATLDGTRALSPILLRAAALSRAI